MKIQGAASFALPRDRLWEKLLDPTILQAAIPGCERLERVADGDYRASVSFGIAAIKGRFIIRMTLSDLDPPTAYTLAIDGEGGPGFVKGSGRITLHEKTPVATELTYDGDVQVGGLIAAIGQRMLAATAQKIANDFFERLQTVIAKA